MGKGPRKITWADGRVVGSVGGVWVGNQATPVQTVSAGAVKSP